jgi:hypothetical protein
VLDPVACGGIEEPLRGWTGRDACPTWLDKPEGLSPLTKREREEAWAEVVRTARTRCRPGSKRSSSDGAEVTCATWDGTQNGPWAKRCEAIRAGRFSGRNYRGMTGSWSTADHRGCGCDWTGDNRFEPPCNSSSDRRNCPGRKRTRRDAVQGGRGSALLWPQDGPCETARANRGSMQVRCSRLPASLGKEYNMSGNCGAAAR